MPVQLAPARGVEELGTVGALLREYADSLGIDLDFQGFEAELADLPGKYRPPAGELLLARDDGGEAVGCVGIRPLSMPGCCEMKRLYVRPSGQGTGVGRALATAAVAFAAGAGYRRLVLDTLPSMVAAQALYHSLGFEPIPAYWDSAIPGTLYFGKQLAWP